MSTTRLETIITVLLGLLGLGVMAGQGFHVNVWVLVFWGAAAVVAFVAWLHKEPSTTDGGGPSTLVLGNLGPAPPPPPLSATVQSPPSENVKVVDSAKAELVPKLEPIALFFDEADPNCYQTGGRVEGKVNGENVVCDETIYRIGVRSNTALPKCRLVLVGSEPVPHDPGMHRLQLPMRPRIPVSSESEEFNVNPNTPAYVDVLQEIRPLNNPLNEAANIRLIYAYEYRGKANWFEGGRYVETFQVQGPTITIPIKFRLEVEFDGRRWRVRSG